MVLNNTLNSSFLHCFDGCTISYIASGREVRWYTAVKIIAIWPVIEHQHKTVAVSKACALLLPMKVSCAAQNSVI